MTKQPPTRYDRNGRPVFGRTIRCDRCLGKGRYRRAGDHKEVNPCPICDGAGFMNRTQEPFGEDRA